MKADTIEASAVEWLRYERYCALIALERAPTYGWVGRPDIVGVTKKRTIIEIEVKRTVADFRANAGKRCFSFRQRAVGGIPEQFYFLVTPEIVETVQPAPLTARCCS